MAVAYAGLVSLLNTMDQIQNHPRLSTSFDNYQFESLREKLDFFLDFVENYSDFVIREKVDFLVDLVENYPDADSREAEDLVRRIAVAAHEAENIIEFEAADRIRAASTQQSPRFMADLQKIIQGMDYSIKEKVIKVKEEFGLINWQPTSSMSAPSSSAPPATTKTTTMVGFDGYLEQLLDELTGQQSDRRIIPIVGMGGIGKTTLARNVYQNLLTVHHFDVRAWITVSQEFSACEILLQALSCLGGSNRKMDTTDDQQLGHELYKVLLGRRYLVVLDDVWTVEAWEKIKFFFPENNNGSRILITTRQQELVDYFGSSALAVKFLDDKNSWELFCEKTFAQQGCPPQLEQVGKKIVDKCKGLPLAIILVGGLLGKSPRTQDYWEKIANDRSLILDSEEGNKPLSILYLSYKHLPVCLKSCFLYLGLFPEDYRINVTELIKVWVAEGFIKTNRNQSLEEVAESYIEQLVDRNLLLVDNHVTLNLKWITCYVHDLVRDMCIRIAEKESFYCVERDIDGMRHFVVDETTARFYPRQSHDTSETPAPAPASLICPLILQGQSAKPFEYSRLLRVLFRHKGRLDYPFRQVNLRFLFNEFDRMVTYSLPSSISLLWSLQTLIVTGIDRVVAPSEIWKMPLLRHIQMWGICLPDPPPSDDDDVVFGLQNLQTLKRAESLNFTEEVCKRIPNIKELDIHYKFDAPVEASRCYHMQNVCCLSKLESLQYSCWGWKYAGDSLQNFKLPSSLKELSLTNSYLVWSDMSMIGLLPHLQILKLEGIAVVGDEWNCVEGELFLCMKHLTIDGCEDLVYWNIADSCCSIFPVLETLYLDSLSYLCEIPPRIGEIPTLERMDVSCCSESATISAVKMLEEQESNGNMDLRLEIDISDDTGEEILFEEKIKLMGSTCQNLLINGISYYSAPETYN